MLDNATWGIETQRSFVMKLVVIAWVCECTKATASKPLLSSWSYICKRVGYSLLTGFLSQPVDTGLPDCDNGEDYQVGDVYTDGETETAITEANIWQFQPKGRAQFLFCIVIDRRFCRLYKIEWWHTTCYVPVPCPKANLFWSDPSIICCFTSLCPQRVAERPDKTEQHLLPKGCPETLSTFSSS